MNGRSDLELFKDISVYVYVGWNVYYSVYRVRVKSMFVCISLK